MWGPSGGPSGDGAVRHVPVIDRYVSDIAARVGRITRPDGSTLKVVYDCGNGAAALVAPQLMTALGIDGIGLFTESDGTFPNHHPDPTVPENLEDCISAVKASGAEIGVAFDGDADRIGVVDRDGRIIWGDHILILYARDVLARTLMLRYFNNRAYYRLLSNEAIDNPDQRISEDARNFTVTALSSLLVRSMVNVTFPEASSSFTE